MLTTNQKNKAGFSLLELLLVVAVGAVLILAGLGAYRLVSENNNTNQAARLLTTLKQQIQQSFQGQSTYGTTSILDDLVTLHALPSDIATTGTGNTMTGKGPFGLIAIAGATNSFTMTFNDVPKGACIRLAQQFTPQNSNDFVSLKVGTAAAHTQSSTNMTQATFMTECVDTTASNDMVWTFN